MLKLVILTKSGRLNRRRPAQKLGIFLIHFTYPEIDILIGLIKTPQNHLSSTQSLTHRSFIGQGSAGVNLFPVAISYDVDEMNYKTKLSHF